MLPKDFIPPESIQEMFPKDYILPESIRARLLDDITVYVKSIMVHYGEDQETFMLECIPTNRHLEFSGDYCDVKLKSNAPGYVLTTLLNIDFEAVAEIIANLEWKKNDKEYIDPPLNYEEVYNQLLSVSDVFNFYLPNEWNRIQYDLETTNEGVAHTVKMLKKYIAFCERKQIPYIGQFYTFLISVGYFDITPYVIMPVEQIESVDSLRDEVGEFTNELDEIYDMFLSELDPGTAGLNCYLLGPEDRLRDIAMISFNELANRGKTIRQCQNCGKYFIPSKRADTLYCDNPSPEAPEMTCKEYGNRRLWYEKQKEDELATLSRNIASAKCMLAKRNPDRPEYAASYEYFKRERLTWKKAVEEGQKTKEEYREWLLLMQSQKRIKEAGQNCTHKDM